jgi:transmembrane sensor
MNYESDPKGNKPSSVIDFPDTQSIEAQAAAWMAKLDTEEPSKQDLREFSRWVNEDESHREAFEGMIAFWDEMNVLTQAVLPREVIDPGTADSPTQVATRRFGWLARGSLAGAALMLLLVISTLWIVPSFQRPQPLIYVTQVGEQKNIDLPDGSTVLLNTNSRLEVGYNELRRKLTLERGEAHFDVFHNPNRPFEVQAGKGLVRAIGTAFTVHVRKVDVEVIVTEGTVEVDRAEPVEASITFTTAQTSLSDVKKSDEEIVAGEEHLPFEAGIQVKAGNKLVYDKEVLAQVKLAVASKVEEQLSWHEGMLIFKGEPLEQVVVEVSRYTGLKIVIPERKTRELKVGGIFKVGDTDSLFEALRDGFDIHVKEISDDTVYLISRENR